MQTNKTAEAFLEWQLTDRGAACSAVDTLTGKDAQKYLGNRLREAFYAGAALNQPAGEPVEFHKARDSARDFYFAERHPSLNTLHGRAIYERAFESGANWAIENRCTHPAPAQACKVPEWADINEREPELGKEVTIKLIDDSVLTGCMPQVDGDFYCDALFGEFFVCASDVVAWLAAAPEVDNAEGQQA